MAKKNPPYEVGYGKPPRNTQFTKGKSGNSKGRPKGSTNLATIVLKESRKPVRVTDSRGPHTVNKLEAIAMQLFNKAAQGDARAARDLFALVRWSEETDAGNAVPVMLNEMDQKIMDSIRRRMEKTAADTNIVKTDLPGESK